MKPGKLIIISGSSGVGKTTVANAVQPKIDNFQRIITYTTRDIRPNEVSGKDYHFIDEREFKEKIDSNFFLEWARVYDNYYGNCLKNIKQALDGGKNIILVVDIQGAKMIKEKMPESIVIFLLHESVQQLEKRLRQRPSTTEQNLQTRIQKAQSEIEESKTISDHRIINKEGRLDETVETVIKIINSLA